jgi:hypothetical protein
MWKALGFLVLLVGPWVAVWFVMRLYERRGWPVWAMIPCIVVSVLAVVWGVGEIFGVKMGAGEWSDWP